MAIVLNTAVGSIFANSYVTLIEAEAYQETRLHNQEWINASESDKNAALVWAARLMNDLEWVGYRANHNQSLDWPRSGVYDKEGYYVDSNTIPVKVKNAQCEQAFRLLVEDRTGDDPGSGLEKLKVDVIDLTFKEKSVSGSISKSCYEMISEFLVNTSSTGEKGFASIVRT